eukprot:GHVR01156123.1.p1 GENE.GHVR01156123.1~~GHVR01156123.1.p1  ORF type:complete len:284 (+),score=70.54 GHVR01156123.1:35-886(+)
MSKTLSPFTEEDIKEVRERVSTPCHLYSEVGLRETCKSLIAAFSWCKGYSNFFAVKANPNPYLLNIMKEAGFGCDCSSMAELILAESCGFIGDNIMFSSNNTPISEFKKAKELGAIINLDDISHIEYINERIGLPDMLSFRYNPGPLRTGNKIIGDPIEAKFGLTRDQILPAYTKAKQLGVTKFGIHAMVVSNCTDPSEFALTVRMLLELLSELSKVGVSISLMNLGGGIGVSYAPDTPPIQFETFGKYVHKEVQTWMDSNNAASLPRIVTECGRCVCARVCN